MRKRKFTFLIIAIVMIVAMVTAIAACDPDDPATEEEIYSTTLIANGNFDSASGDSQPMTPDSWTGEAGSTSSSAQYKTPTDNVHSGVIDVSNSRDYRDSFGSIEPGKVGKDNNILAIYNGVEASSYKYTSSSVTLSADRVYKLSVWVKTDIFTDRTYYEDWLNRGDDTQDFDESKAGAYVYVNGVAYAAFEAVNTSGEWQELVTYIDTHNSAGGSITIVLSLGTGNYSTGYMTAGYAYFDDITLVDLNEEYADSDSAFVDGDSSLSDEQADAKAAAEYASAKAGTSTSNIVDGAEAEASHRVHTAKYDMSSGDTDFNYVTKTSTPYSSSRWTGKAGTKTDGSSFGTSASNLQRGVLDTSSMDTSVINDASKYSGLTLDAHGTLSYDYGNNKVRTASNILYIQARNANVYGYTSNTAYTIEANNYYKISVWVKTYILSGRGAAIRLTTGDDDESVVAISDINTNGAWTEYSLYLQGNQYRENTVTLELWLGDNNTAGSEGIAFFDSVSVSNVGKDAYDAAAEGATVAKDDMRTDDTDFKYYYMDSLKYEVSDKAASSNTVLANVGDSVDGITVNKALESYDNKVWVINNRVPAYATVSPVVTVTDSVDAANLIPLKANSYLAVSVWVKTSDITSGGLNVTLYNYDIDAITEALEETPEADFTDLADYRTSVASLSSLTSEGLEDFKIDGVNDYVMLTFMVQSGKTAAHLGLEFTLGSGSATNSSSFVKGYALISNIMTEAITASDYSGATTATNVAKGSVSAETADVEIASNGFFNTSDISGTNSLYATDDNKFDFNKEDGNLNGVLALPDGWSATDSTKLTAYNNDTGADTYAFGGVLDLNNISEKYLEIIGGSQIETLLNGGKDGIFASAGKYSGLSADNNVLAVYSHNLAAFGFSSDEFSLSSNSYYRVSVWAYAEPGSQISIVISTGSDDTEYTFFKNSDETTAGWKEYVFYIQTGVSSVSASLSLYVGNSDYADDNTGSANYSALFTGANYQSITEEDFDAYVSLNRADTQTVSMLVNTMDNVTANEDALNSPSDWSSTKIDSEASDDDVSAGVFDRQNHDWNELLDLDIAGDDAALYEALYNSGTVDTNINNSSITTGIGDMVLVIYNHADVLDDEGNLSGGAYRYTSSDLTLNAGSYYKITIWVLTYKLGADDSARVALKLGNSTYTFGGIVDEESSAVEKVRRINTSTYGDDGKETVGAWKEISFYVYIDKDVEESVTGNLTVQLGDTDEWVSGYAFFDNFSCVEIDPVENGDTTTTPAQIVSGKVGFDVVYTNADDATKNNDFTDSNAFNEDGSIKEGALLSANYIVHYTQADAESTPEEEETTDDEGKDSLLWLYITSGVIGGLIVIAVVVVLARKIMKKRKRQKQVGKKSDFDRNYGGKSEARKK